MTIADVVVLASKEEVIERVAEDARRVLARALSEHETAHFVLTGGTVGIGVLCELGEHDDASVDWSRVHLWWGDERWVPRGSADRNDEQARVCFWERLPFSSENIHRMPGADDGVSLDDAALLYAQELSVWSTDAVAPRFDLLLLGVGPDGHVASLFPRHPDAESRETVVPVRNSPKPPPERLSLSRGVINRAERVWVVAAGHDKAEAVSAAQGPDDLTRAPVSTVNGLLETRLYCDVDAAGPS